jgi:hypothetical protein
MRPNTPVLLGLAALLSTGVGQLAGALSPAPSADVGRGTEEVFASGLHAREIPPRQAPQRWTTDRATFVFRNLAKGPATLEVVLDGQRGPVAVVCDGVTVGTLAPGSGSARFSLPSGGSTRRVEIRSPTFVAGDGRRLGVLLRRVRLEPAAPAAGLAVWLLFLIPGLAAAGGALHARVPPTGVVAAAALVVAVQWAALWPGGALRSGYALRLALALTLVCLALALLARALDRRIAGAAPWAFGALLTAVLVQGVGGTSPLMVVSDAMFHANKLGAVARGDFFPLSVTQHAQPFRFPYGVSFYATLAPLWRAGVDPVTLVRFGAATAGILASLVFFVLLARVAPRLAGAAVIALQLIPATFDVAFSYGNLSNAFGQAATLAFFAWWAGRGWGGAPVGACLLVLAGLGHFSSLVVLLVLLPALALMRGRSAEGLDRRRIAALAVGLSLLALYYLQFWGVVTSQLPRLLEGGGQGRGASRSAWDAARFQLLGALAQWGAPAIVLAVLGWPRRRDGAWNALDRDLRAYWWAGLLLAVPAVVSPLEVRYLYALTVPLSVATATGLWRLHDAGGARRLLGWTLVAAQATLAVRGIAEAVVSRYRLH